MDDLGRRLSPAPSTPALASAALSVVLVVSATGCEASTPPGEVRDAGIYAYDAGAIDAPALVIDAGIVDAPPTVNDAGIYAPDSDTR